MTQGAPQGWLNAVDRGTSRQTQEQLFDLLIFAASHFSAASKRQQDIAWFVLGLMRVYVLA
jgi:hypothetical protein